MADAVTFTPARGFEAEGARVGLVTCERCGAAILLDPADDVDPVAVHRAWHAGGPAAARRAGREEGSDGD